MCRTQSNLLSWNRKVPRRRYEALKLKRRAAGASERTRELLEEGQLGLMNAKTQVHFFCLNKAKIFFFPPLPFSPLSAFISPPLGRNNPRSCEWQSHFPIKPTESSELSLKFSPSFGEAAKRETESEREEEREEKGWCGCGRGRERGDRDERDKLKREGSGYRLAFDSHQYTADVIRY